LDGYYLAKEIIALHFKQRGMVVTYLPKPTPEEMGNGCHMHISVWRDGKNITGDPSNEYMFSKEGEHFMAGILKNYDALFHFMCPSPNSLRRI
jgi:glutamine synthetase